MYTFESISHGSLFRYIFEHEENRQQAREVFKALTGCDSEELRIYGEGSLTLFLDEQECYCLVADFVMPYRRIMAAEFPSERIAAGFESLAVKAGPMPAHGRQYFLADTENSDVHAADGLTVFGLNDACAFAPSCVPWQEYTAFIRRVYSSEIPDVAEIYDAIYACMPAGGSLWHFMRRHADEIVRIIFHAHAVGAGWKQGHGEGLGRGFAEGFFGTCVLLKISRETSLKLFAESTGMTAAKTELLYRYVRQPVRTDEIETYIGKESGLLFAKVFADEENHACAEQLYRQLGGSGKLCSVSADQGFLEFAAGDGSRMAVHDFDGIMGCGLLSSFRMAGSFHRRVQNAGVLYERVLALFHGSCLSRLIRYDSEGCELKDPLIRTVCTSSFSHGPLHDHALFCSELHECLRRLDDPHEIVRAALAELPEDSLLGQYLSARIQDITATAFLEIDMALAEREGGGIAHRISIGCGALQLMKLLCLPEEKITALMKFIGFSETDLPMMLDLLESLLPVFRSPDLVTF